MVEISDSEYKMISEFVKNNYGINLSESKKTLIKGRLQNILTERKLSSFSDYYNYVINDQTGDALTEMINKMTTNYTYFMRESKHFDYLKDIVLPYYVNTQKEKELRVWSAGCSSGEEAYTIGMIIQDFMKSNNKYFNAKILATDISNKALLSAQKAEYLNESIDTLPLDWKNKYFKMIDEEKSVVDDKVKNMVKLAYLNLMDPYFPFKKKFHIIFCRNVMIYFDAQTKDNLVEKYYNALEPGGYLFIGHSEALNREKTKFKYIKPAIYRKEK